MKKLISMFAAVVLLASAVVTSVPASAASGVDVVHTFENYMKAKDFISSEWTTFGCFTSSSIHTDTSTSAPNRGDGKSKGNYRSMRCDFDLSKEGWGSVRNRTEDNYVLIDPVNANSDVYFTFYAKASETLNILAEVDVKDVPFYQQITLTTEWKQYRLKLRDLVPELADTAGNMTNIYDRNAVKHWGNGTEEAFLIGFKFQVGNLTGVQKGSFWLDTLAFEGEMISERREFTNEGGSTFDTLNDLSGSVPKDFVATTSSTTTSTTSGTTSTGKTNAGTTSTGKTSTGKTGTTSTATTSTTSAVASTDATTSTDSTVSDVSSDVDSTDSSEVISEVSSTEKTSSKKNTSAKVEDTEEGLSTGAKVAIIVSIIVVLAGAGVAVYFFVFKKKKQ